jgi:Spy/CpxP family protein refolding chaperone
MGQQQQQTMAVGTTLRRMITVVAVAALMVLVMAASAMPAMAKNAKGSDGGPPMESGDITDANGGASVGGHGSGGACVNHDGPKRSGHCT